MKKFAIQDENGRFLWGMTSRSGVHFDQELMPQFWEINAKTKVFDTQEEANSFAVEHNLFAWSKIKIVPMIVEITIKPA